MDDREEKQQQNKPDSALPQAVVGIGASAGGLEVLREFFTGMPTDSGLAFVVIVHLDPEHESHMDDLLAAHTSMRVRAAADGMPVEPDTVYVIPPNAYLYYEDGRLCLNTPLRRGGAPMAVDYFFRSLADELRDQSICVVLSGAGSDGTLGVRACRAAGGLVIVEDPEEAKYDSMPRSAVRTGMADFILPVGQMPDVLMRFVRDSGSRREKPTRLSDGNTADMINAILNQVLVRTGSDFRYYKKTTILRRIERRMSILQIETLPEYLRYIREQPKETDELSKDMLIGVTSFFREREAWDELLEQAVLPMVKAKTNDTPIRAWIAGCSTGEEAYSMAILTSVALAETHKRNPVQIFATDVDESALQMARAGTYPLSIANDVPEEYLDRFFTKQERGYQVKKPLREMIVFSPQNLVSDPPFSKLDLVACRNVLIYLEPEVQKRVVGLFGFSLHEGGYLFLGKSERVPGYANLFELVSDRWRIYRRTGVAPAAVDLPVAPSARQMAAEGLSVPREKWPRVNLAEIHQQALQRHLEAASVLVDYRGNILHFFGSTERYLRHPTGEASLNIMRMARPELDLRLRMALRDVEEKKRIVRLYGVRMEEEGAEPTRMDVTVIPIGDPSTGERLAAIIFEPQAEPVPREAGKGEQETDRSYVERLQAELRMARSDLQNTVEDLVSSNEELRAANEEMTSMNEELQSSNEELQSSKEELQSVNEELTTLNDQLTDKVDELGRANNDLANLISSTGVATVFLGRDLRIKRYTPAAAELLNLIPSDVGRPIEHITLRFEGDLARDAKQVLQNLHVVERQIRTREGQWYIMRLLPYRTVEEDRIEGVVITFSEVTRLKELQAEELARFSKYADPIVGTVRQPMLVLDGNLRVRMANDGFYREFQVLPRDTEGQLLYDLGSGQWDIPQLRSLLEEIIPQNAVVEDYRVEHEFPRIGQRTMLLNARRMELAQNGERLILLVFEDVTQVAQEQERLDEYSRELQQRLREAEALAENRAVQLRVLALELTQAEDRERRALAQMVQDQLQELLVSAQARAAALQRQGEDGERSRLLRELDALLSQLLDASRSLRAELAPPPLSDGKLLEALSWLTEQAQRRYGLTVELEADEDAEPKTQELREFLFRAVHELLLNVAKHAGVPQARVIARRLEGDRVMVEVADEGRGCDPEALTATLAGAVPSAERLGLFSIRERAVALGGDMRVEGAPGEGCRISVTVPLGLRS